MALTSSEWKNWRARMELSVEAKKYFLAVLNDEFEPVCEIPNVVDLEAPRSKNAVTDFRCTFPALDKDGQPYEVMDILVDQGFGSQDETSKLAITSDRTWYIMCQFPGGEEARHVYQIVYPRVAFSGFETGLMTIEAQEVLCVLAQWPCPSVPAIWGHEPVRDWWQDAGGKYDKAYRYAPIEMATVANGYTTRGEGVKAIQSVIQDSIDAGYKVLPEFKIPHLVVDQTYTGPSPTVLIRREDKTLWETIEQPAKLSNVQVRVDLWWPGDKPVPVKYSMPAGGFSGNWDRDEAVLVARVIAR